VNRRTRTAAVIGALGLACTGLAVAPTALAAAAAPEDPGCTVSYTTTPVAGPGATVTGLPKEIDFGTNLPAAAGYKVVFHGTPSKLATGFVRAQVVINGNSPPQTDGFNWGNRSPIAGSRTPGSSPPGRATPWITTIPTRSRTTPRATSACSGRSGRVRSSTRRVRPRSRSSPSAARARR
jgi:hypothetical protein